MNIFQQLFRMATMFGRVV